MLPPGANVIKLFTAVSYEFSKQARAFVHGKPFHPSLMFAGKARAYPSEAPRLHSRVGSWASHKHKIRPERVGRDKYSSLIQTFVTYKRKMFNSNGNWLNKLEYFPCKVMFAK
jgi:hypothetical protein